MLAFIAHTAGRVDIAVALASFLVIHRRRVTIAPSLAIEFLLRRPLPSRRPVHHRPVAIVLSIAFHCRCALGRPSPSSSRPPLPSRSHRAVPRHREAVTASLAIEELSHRPLPSRSCRAVPRHHGAIGRVDRPPSQWPESSPTSVTRHTPPGLASGWLSRCLSSCCRLPSAGASHCGIAFRAFCPSGWLSRFLASHAATSHLSAPPPLIAPSPLVTPLLGLSSGWLRRIIENSQRSGLMLV